MFILNLSSISCINVCVYINSPQSDCHPDVSYQKQYHIDELERSDYKLLLETYKNEDINVTFIGYDSNSNDIKKSNYIFRTNNDITSQTIYVSPPTLSTQNFKIIFLEYSSYYQIAIIGYSIIINSMPDPIILYVQNCTVNEILSNNLNFFALICPLSFLTQLHTAESINFHDLIINPDSNAKQLITCPISVSNFLRVEDANLYSIDIQDSFSNNEIHVDIIEELSLITIILTQSVRNVSFDYNEGKKGLVKFTQGGLDYSQIDYLHIEFNVQKNAYINVEVYSYHLFEMSNSDIVVKLISATMEIYSLSHYGYTPLFDVIVYNNSIILTRSDIGFKRLYIHDNTNILVIRENDDNAHVVTFYNFFGLKIESEDKSIHYGKLFLKTSPKITTIIEELSEYSIENQQLNIILLIHQDNNKMECGLLELQYIDHNSQISTDISKPINVLIDYEHKDPSKQYAKDDIQELFYDRYNFISNPNPYFKYNLIQPSNSYFPGFYSRNSILSISEINNVYVGTFDFDAYDSIASIYCFANPDKIQKCNPNASLIISDQNMSALSQTFDFLLNFIAEDRKEMKLEIMIQNNQEDIPQINCEYLRGFNLEIYSSSDLENHPKLDIINAQLGSNAASITASHIYFNTTIFNPQYKMILNDCKFDFDNQQILINENVECRYTLKELEKLGSNLLFSDAHLVINDVSPNDLIRFEYKNDGFHLITRFSQNNDIKIKCTDIVFNIKYDSQQTEFQQESNFQITNSITSDIEEFIDYPKIIIPNFKGYLSVKCGEVDWPDSFLNPESPMINLNQTLIDEGNILVEISNTTAPFFGFGKHGKYKASRELADCLKHKKSLFDLGDPNSLVLFDELVFDSLNNENIELGITGCEIIADYLDVKYNTTAVFDSIKITNRLSIFPGAKIMQQSTRNLLDNDEKSLCDIFGEYSYFYWNSDKNPLIILSENCRINRNLSFRFKYDGDFVEENLKKNYFDEKSLIIKNLAFDDNNNITSYKSDIFLPPDSPSNEWKALSPRMFIVHEKNNLYLGSYSISQLNDPNKKTDFFRPTSLLDSVLVLMFTIPIKI